MKNNYLKSQLLKLQVEYCNLLKLSLEKLKTEDFPYVIDEINLFWFSNRNLIKLILGNLYNDYNCFIHTGASFLYTDNLEHYPFVTVGKSHLIDDPVANFGETLCHDIPNHAFSEKLKEQIILTVEQNIKIIEQYTEMIQILPIRFLNSSEDRNLIKDGAEKAFLGLFINKDLTIDAYLEAYSTIEDVVEGMHDHVKNLIIFSENEEQGSLETRFRKHVSKATLPFPPNTSEVIIFLSLITGYYMQAFDILIISLKYPLNPYLRYPIPLHYIHLLALSIPTFKNKEMEELLLKIKVAYAINEIFDIDKIKNVDFSSYYQYLQDNDFGNNLIRKVEQSFDNPNQAPINDFYGLIEKELEGLYEKLPASV